MFLANYCWSAAFMFPNVSSLVTRNYSSTLTLWISIFLSSANLLAISRISPLSLPSKNSWHISMLRAINLSVR